MVPFAGWEMPVQFQGLIQEHEAVRTSVGMFDISHMGKFFLSGPDILDALSALVPTDLSGLQPGQAQYTVLLNPKGGIIDDLIIYNQGQKNGQDTVALIAGGVLWEWNQLVSKFGISALGEITWLFFGAIYVGAAALAMIAIREDYVPLFVLIGFLLPIIAVDVGAYFAGRYFVLHVQ